MVPAILATTPHSALGHSFHFVPMWAHLRISISNRHYNLTAVVCHEPEITYGFAADSGWICQLLIRQRSYSKSWRSHRATLGVKYFGCMTDGNNTFRLKLTGLLNFASRKRDRIVQNMKSKNPKSSPNLWHDLDRRQLRRLIKDCENTAPQYQ